ncbi:MAG: glycosyltransferase family 39 protein [Candidatus Aureabacteria bacterium]|nr:glycosyltransferase family 39 protein [Candidatus Auribacterota bacterium]
MISRIVSLVLFIAACASFTWAHVVLIPSRGTAAAFAYAASAVLLILRDALFPGPPEHHVYRRWASPVSFAAVVCLAFFFRMRYVSSVPLSYIDEQVVQFLGYAARLMKDGFSYSPIWGYASTLHTYMIALVWKLFGQNLTNVRYYTAFFGILSTMVMFWWMKRLFGLREALIGGVLLAISPYNQWACRNGYNTCYIPLFVMLFFGLLYQMTRSARKIPLAILAGVAFALGMHGHWAFALEAPAALSFLIYCTFTERGFLRSTWLAVIILAVTTALLMTPYTRFFLRDMNRAGYITKATNPNPGARGEKYILNFRTALITYTASYNPLPGNKGVLAAGGIGGLLCLVRFRRSRACALLMMLFAIHLAGLTITTANRWYISYLLIFWLGFAAVAGAEAWRALESLFAFTTWRVATAGGAIAALIVCSVADYRIFFHDYIFSTMHFDPGLMACYAADDILAESKDYDIYLPKQELNNDLGFEPADLAYALPRYNFIISSGIIRTTSLFFPGTPTDAHQGLVAYPPSVPFWKNIEIPRLSSLYPHMAVTPLPAPEPWNAKLSSGLRRLAISAEDLNLRQGLRIERAAPEGWTARGYFVAEAPGTYLFKCAEGCRMEVGGTPVDGPLLLSAGTVSVQITGQGSPTPELHVSRTGPDKKAVEIARGVFNAPPEAEAAIASCISKSAVPCQFVYSNSKTYDLQKAGIDSVTDAVAVGDIIVCVRFNGELIELNKDLSRRAVYPLGGRGNYRLEVSPSGEVFAFRSETDTVYIEKAGSPPAIIKPEGIKPIKGLSFDREGNCYLLTGTKVRVYAPGHLETTVRDVDLPVSSPPPSPMVSVSPEGDILLPDADRQEFIILRASGGEPVRIAMPGFWSGFFTVATSEDEWFVRVHAKEMFVMLDRDLRPLLYPESGWEQNPFRDSSGKRGLDFSLERNIHRVAGTDICIADGLKLYIMSRQQIQ